MCRQCILDTTAEVVAETVALSLAAQPVRSHASPAAVMCCQ
jgi:hypothetical protein